MVLVEKREAEISAEIAKLNFALQELEEKETATKNSVWLGFRSEGEGAGTM